MKRKIECENVIKPIGPYNIAIQYNNLIFISGQIPVDKNGNIISESIEKETEQVLKNIEEILKSIGLSKDNILKTTIFLRNISDFQKVNEIYAKFFEGTIFPARTTVEVSNLPKNVNIEIEAICFSDNIS
ncbi:MAG TPA: RidA family protein [Spirochaetota bacterium]|nr:RidA family protein [Spirochaetota bacterium]HOL57692.1 RidA family protein [Spirochaetota bacterium]HPP03524.1 RidA family protein [Spirochaetota bacterium]